MNCLHLIACLLFLSGSQHVNGLPQASSSTIGNQPLAAEPKSAPALEAKEVIQEHGPSPISTIDGRISPFAKDDNTTTLSPTSPNTVIPSIPSNGTSDNSSTTTSNAPTSETTTPPPATKSTTTNPTTTTSSVPPSTSPSTTTTTTVAPTTPSSTTTEKTTTVTATSTKAPPTTSTAAPEISRRFDGPSFIGGIVFALGFTAIAFVAWKFYKARTERNYHTL